MSKSKTIISIVIATYKRPESLRLTLKSILNCTINGDLDYELIVADNNSKDQTEQVVNELMPSFDGRLKYVFEAEQGKSFALNTAIEHSKGEYLALTDDDCLVDKDWLIQIDRTMKGHPIDILAGKVVPQFDGDLPKWIDMSISAFHGPLVNFNMGDTYFDNSTRAFSSPTGANMTLRRSSFEKFGGFRFVGRAEDSDIGYRWRKEGANIGYTPEAIVYHLTPVSRLTKSYFRKWQFLNGKVLMLIGFEDMEPSKRNFMGVPWWIYKRFLKSVWHYIKGIFTSRNKFANELSVLFHLGEICAFKGISVGFEKMLR